MFDAIKEEMIAHILRSKGLMAHPRAVAEAAKALELAWDGVQFVLRLPKEQEKPC